ncbi:MAG: EI24 domain-containing protein [Kiloniellales bacterium]|nr:EI24 domain-containing protein [Kiloniellales bacterium]
MFSQLAKAFGQLGDPRIRGLVLVAILAALAVLAALSFVASYLLMWGGDLLSEWIFAGEGDSWLRGLAEWLVDAASVAAVVFASFLLFPAAIGLVLSLFLERVAAAVEARHYPALPPARDQPLGEAVWSALVFAAVTIAVNLLALPFYLLLLFLPPFNLLLFYMVNGYLLGREYFEVVALRRLDAAAAKRLRRASRVRVFLAGVVVALLLTIPIVNIVTPVVATAFMVHVFHRLRERTA